MTGVRVLILLGMILGCDESTGPEAGLIRVTVFTGGESLDPDGFSLQLDGRTSRIVGDSDAVGFDGLPAGVHRVEMSGVAENCSAAGGTVRALNLTAGDTADVSYQVTCVPPFGSIDLSVQTSGQGVDQDGYALTVDGGPPSPIGTQATISMTGVAMGSHQILLSGLSSNCGVRGENPRPIQVHAGGIALLSFDVVCFVLSGELLVQSARTGAWHLYRMQADGTGITDLTPDTETFEGDWSRDGQRIVFTEIRDSRPVIGVMNRDGSDRRSLGVEGDAPKWSPDGSKIVFDSAFKSIRVMHADGSNVHTLGTGRSPDWSPEGAKIIFSRGQVGDSWAENIWVMAADGSRQRQLTTNPSGSSSYLKAASTLPAWSPDGGTIAFVQRYTFGPSGLYLMNADGSDRRRISSIVPYEPLVWSPDGTLIAIAAWNGDETSDLAQDVTVIPSTGGDGIVVGSSQGPDYPTSWR